MSTETIKTAARQGLLKMAQEWHKNPDTIHHAIKAYKEIISNDFDSLEAKEAESALLRIAEEWRKQNKKYAASRLYKELVK